MKIQKIWQCRYCTYMGLSRTQLQYHHKEFHGFTKTSHPAWNKGLTKQTDKRINVIADKVSKTLTGKPGHKHSDRTKHKLSQIRKEFIKQNNGIWWSSRSNCKRSYAEEWLKNILHNELNDYSFKEEFHVGRWFMDFAWPDKMIYIEIDGEQHEWPERILNDIEKDSYYKSIGWKGLRLKWKEVINNTSDAINLIKTFVTTSTILEHHFLTKQEEHELNCINKGYIKNIKGHYSYKKLSDDIWLKRKDEILNSNVDLTKYGWVNKVASLTNLTRRQINETINHFPELLTIVFYRHKNSD